MTFFLSLLINGKRVRFGVEDELVERYQVILRENQVKVPSDKISETFSNFRLTLVFPLRKTSVVNHRAKALLGQLNADQNNQSLICSVFQAPKNHSFQKILDQLPGRLPRPNLCTFHPW